MSIRPTPPEDLLGLPVHPVTMQQAVALVEQAVASRTGSPSGGPYHHLALNGPKWVYACRDVSLAQSVRSADLVTADGVGVLALARRLGRPLPERVTGIDLMTSLCTLAAQRRWPVYLLGGAPGVAAGAAAALRRRDRELPIAGVHHGCFEQERLPQLCEGIAASGARLLFVGLPTPTKEAFAGAWGQECGVDFIMGVGGSFDVLCGRRHRAPVWLQGLGLEWAYRWAQEPVRLSQRYGLGGLRFVRDAMVLQRQVPTTVEATSSTGQHRRAS